MSKSYDIQTMGDLDEFYNKARDFQKSRDSFQRMTIICKKYVKPRSGEQLRAYWSVISRLKDLLKTECGIVANDEDLHEWVKTRAGFTKMIHMPDGTTYMATKSISDQSPDVNAENMNFLISFIQQWAAENLGAMIDVGGEP